MIYSVYWGGLAQLTPVTKWNISAFPGKGIGDVIPGTLDAFAGFVKSSEDDSFVFILTNYTAQQAGYNMDTEYKSVKDQFDEWVQKHGLEDYIVVRSKGITNPMHQEIKHNLSLVVMQSLKHFARVGQVQPQKEVVDAL